MADGICGIRGFHVDAGLLEKAKVFFLFDAVPSPTLQKSVQGTRLCLLNLLPISARSFYRKMMWTQESIIARPTYSVVLLDWNSDFRLSARPNFQSEHQHCAAGKGSGAAAATRKPFLFNPAVDFRRRMYCRIMHRSAGLARCETLPRVGCVASRLLHRKGKVGAWNLREIASGLWTGRRIS